MKIKYPVNQSCRASEQGRGSPRCVWGFWPELRAKEDAWALSQLLPSHVPLFFFPPFTFSTSSLIFSPLTFSPLISSSACCTLAAHTSPPCLISPVSPSSPLSFSSFPHTKWLTFLPSFSYLSLHPLSYTATWLLLRLNIT